MAELSSEENSNKIIEKCVKFLQDGCGCALGEKGVSCSTEFTEEIANLNNCLELTGGELDLVIFANIQVFTRVDCVGEKRRRSRSPRSSFHFQGRQICKEMFLHVYGIGYARFLRLKEHWEEHGLS